MPIDPFSKVEISDLYQAFVNNAEMHKLKPKATNTIGGIPVSPPPPTPPVGFWALDDFETAAKAMGSPKKGKPKPPIVNEHITTHISTTPIEMEAEEPFHLKKVAQPNVESVYSNLESVKTQLEDMINFANSKGLDIPKMLLRAYHRIHWLEDMYHQSQTADEAYESGYKQGYKDGKAGYSNVFDHQDGEF